MLENTDIASDEVPSDWGLGKSKIKPNLSNQFRAP